MKNFKGNSFAEFTEYTEKLTEKGKGDIFEELTYYLFKLEPTLNKNLEEIWLYKDIPKKIKKKLSLPSIDKGIDLLFLMNDEYYTVQCKYRQDPKKKLTWHDLSSFFGMSFGMNNKIKKGYFVTNTYNLCNEVRDSEKIDSIAGDFFDKLPSSFFKKIRKILDNDDHGNITINSPLFSFPHPSIVIDSFEEDKMIQFNPFELGIIFGSRINPILGLLIIMNLNQKKQRGHNIFYTNLHGNNIEVYQNEQWITYKTDHIIEKIIDAKIKCLDILYDAMKRVLSPRTINSIKETKQNMLKSKNRKIMGEQIKIILASMHMIVQKTRNLQNEKLDNNDYKEILLEIKKIKKNNKIIEMDESIESEETIKNNEEQMNNNDDNEILEEINRTKKIKWVESFESDEGD